MKYSPEKLAEAYNNLIAEIRNTGHLPVLTAIEEEAIKQFGTPEVQRRIVH